ncbi:hypothetical protein NUH87_25695 [Pseudomonas batumici]|uniref:hypothetical protein n=1 Tax=Pseudomonas batumici TaxID=226910 RepID=UPI0030D4F535
MADLPVPHIPGLLAGNIIDIEQLAGDPLRTYIKYDVIAIHDVLWPNWRGCSAQGQVHDYVNQRVDVTVAAGYTPELGMPVDIPHSLIKHLDQGWGFYSYSVAPPADPTNRGPESQRQFCYVGVRSSALPVPQVKESHALALDPATTTVTAVVSPYAAMSVGDKVKLFWEVFYHGLPDDLWSQTKTLVAEDIGRPLSWAVPRSFVVGMDYVEARYTVEYIGGGDSESIMQVIEFVPPDPNVPLLVAVRVKDLVGTEIDPRQFPDGLTLIIDLDSGMLPGDEVLLYWTGERSTASVIKSLRIDLSVLDSGVLEFHLEPRWLTDNQGGEVHCSYQYAREGFARSSVDLVLRILLPRNLPPPQIQGATPEGSGGEYKGFLLAQSVRGGVTVSVPAEVQIGPDERVEMHWAGYPNNGNYIARTAESDGSYFIPPRYVPANMAFGESRRFPVFYLIIPGAGQPTPSDAFNLRIQPLESSTYPTVYCEQARGGPLSLGSVTEDGVDICVELWTFMGQGQWLTLQVTGTRPGGGAIDPYFLLTDYPVNNADVSARKISRKLPRDILRQLALNASFTLKASISFDNGDSAYDCLNGYVELRA